MGIPQNKAELLLAIDTNFSKLFKALQAVPESRVREPTLAGHSKGTTMSVVNLLAYLIGWNELLIKWIERDAAGLPVDFPETGFKWNELGGWPKSSIGITRGSAIRRCYSGWLPPEGTSSNWWRRAATCSCMAASGMRSGRSGG